MNSGFAATGQPPSLGKRGVLQRTLEPGPHWRLYCTIRRLPFVARRWRRQATEVSCWKRRRIAYLTPPLWEGVSLPKATTPRGKRLTAFSVAYGSLRMQFAAHRSGQRSGARPTTLSPIHPIGEKFKKVLAKFIGMGYNHFRRTAKAGGGENES